MRTLAAIAASAMLALAPVAAHAQGVGDSAPMAGPPAAFSGVGQLYGYGHLAEMITFSGAYAGPGFGYAETSSRAAGTDIVFLCQAVGPTAVGPYGADDLWDRTAMGQYVPDADVYTGSNGQVGAPCS